MLRVIPKSAILNYMITIITQLKWAWDFILYQSFFQSRQMGLLQCPDNGLGVTHHHSKNPDSDESEKMCSVARVWSWHVPVMPGNVKPRQLTAELIQELVVFNFSATRSRDDWNTWWLR
ncbi:hypothetical protein ACS0TY_009648 [Phlomoides rotata]